MLSYAFPFSYLHTTCTLAFASSLSNVHCYTRRQQWCSSTQYDPLSSSPPLPTKNHQMCRLFKMLPLLLPLLPPPAANYIPDFRKASRLSLSNREELTKGETPNFPPPTAAALLLKGPPQKIAAAAGAASASSSHWREKDDGWRGRNGWILWLVA